MASENPSLDLKLELHNLVSHLYFSAKKEEKEIENLIDRVNSVIESTERRHKAKYLRNQIEAVKGFQRNLSKKLSDIGMEFCQMVDQDCKYSSFQKVLRQELNDLEHGKQTINDEKISRVTKKLEFLGKKQAKIKKDRELLNLEFLNAFPWETRKPSKEYIYDHSEIGTGTDSIGKVKIGETWWSLQILTQFEKDRNSSGLEPWNLEKVMTRMYGFNLDKVQTEFELMRRLEEALHVACNTRWNLRNNGLIKLMIERKRSKLEALLYVIRATKNGRNHNDELRQAKGVLIEWLSHIEGEIFFISLDLILCASICDERGPESIREKFRRKLLEPNRQRGGRVLLVVYRLIKFLEVNGPESLENTFNNIYDTTENSLMIPNITRVLEAHVYSMILSLMSVLYANTGLCCLELSEKEVLIGSVAIVEMCDDSWRVIRKYVDEKILNNV